MSLRKLRLIAAGVTTMRFPAVRPGVNALTSGIRRSPHNERNCNSSGRQRSVQVPAYVDSGSRMQWTLSRRSALSTLRFALTAAILSLPNGVEAGGWYLMLPPWRVDAGPRVTVRGDAPIREWESTAGFDSATACESTRATLMQNAQRERPRATAPWSKEALQAAAELYAGRSVTDEQMDEFSKYLYPLRAASAQCVASDDPRLK